MRRADLSATIKEFVEDTTEGDTVSVETKNGRYLNEQRVCDTYELNGGKIVCVTVGGSIPMMVIETVTDEVHAHAYTYKEEEYIELGKLREYGLEGHPKSDDYEATGWLNADEFIQAIK